MSPHSEHRSHSDSHSPSLSLPRSPRKRATLRALASHDGPVTISTLADAVAASEHETPRSELATDQCKPISRALYRTVLPDLDEDGLLEYDRPRGLVSLTVEPERVRTALESGEASAGTADDTTGRTASVAAATESATAESTAMVTSGTLSLFGIASLGLLATPAAASGVLLALFALSVGLLSRSS